MLGYTNPWAVLIRKQCEAVPVAVQGVYDLAMSLLVDVPFAKCICVDAATRGSNFERYAMDNCYFFAPTHLKPVILGLIENARYTITCLTSTHKHAADTPDFQVWLGSLCTRVVSGHGRFCQGGNDLVHAALVRCSVQEHAGHGL